MSLLVIGMQSKRILYSMIRSQRSLVISRINQCLRDSYIVASILSYVFELMSFGTSYVSFILKLIGFIICINKNTL